MSSRPFGPFAIGKASRRLVAGPDGCADASADSRETGPSAAATTAVLDHAFRNEGPSLLRYLGRRAGYDAAPDMLQEVFVRAAGSAQVGRLNNPAAFLRRVARNLLIDRSRRRGADDVIVFPLDEEQHAASLPEQEHHLEARDLMRLYEGAVDALPEKTRRVFLMHRVDELSYREIHERLGISIATVEYHMMKALAQIARAVDAGR
ncbi:RNA polymerase sigma factor [Novosphingobium sp. Fuku2-ISO-50]|uniref:RNA polymerase sigma factor n=1 Tax=Novosphingobium sp. Fuku2-ISO-50 TaxID=1739114 RepID=UPI00350F32CF